jgi:L-amino acid N-acyltransferase YncA
MVSFMNEPTQPRIVDIDGVGRFTVRPMEPADTPAVVDGFQHLSPESSFRRFFSPVPRMLDAERLARIVGLRDGHRVLLAFDERGHLAGGARAVPDPDDPGAVELSVTIGDRWQHHGLGRRLMRLLVHDLRREGVERIRGHVLVDNPAAKALVGPGAHWWFDGGGVVAFEVPLPQRASAA